MSAFHLSIRRWRGAIAIFALSLSLGSGACATGAGVYHKVGPGESLWAIARAYDTDPAAIAQANPHVNPYGLRPGDQVFVPDAEKVLPSETVAKAAKTAKSSSKEGKTAKSTKPNHAPAKADKGGTASAKKPAPKNTGKSTASKTPVKGDSKGKTAGLPYRGAGMVPEPEPRRPGEKGDGTWSGACTFAWPVDGVVTSLFGMRWNRPHTGIDIQAPQGTPVLAAAAGEVVFSASEQAGYGDLMVVRHHDGWITVYAHLSARLVEKGSKVRQGQMIGRVGQTGRATTPHLHFEIRKHKEAVNPLPLLPRRDSAGNPVADEEKSRGAAPRGI